MTSGETVTRLMAAFALLHFVAFGLWCVIKKFQA